MDVNEHPLLNSSPTQPQNGRRPPSAQAPPCPDGVYARTYMLRSMTVMAGETTEEAITAAAVCPRKMLASRPSSPLPAVAFVGAAAPAPSSSRRRLVVLVRAREESIRRCCVVVMVAAAVKWAGGVSWCAPLLSLLRCAGGLGGRGECCCCPCSVCVAQDGAGNVRRGRPGGRAGRIRTHEIVRAPDLCVRKCVCVDLNEGLWVRKRARDHVDRSNFWQG